MVKKNAEEAETSTEIYSNTWSEFDQDKEQLANVRKQIRMYTILTFVVALSIGILQMSYFPSLFYVKKELSGDPHEYVRFKSISNLPLSLIPLIAYFEDSMSPFYSRIRYWMIIGCLLNIVPCTIIVMFRVDLWSFTGIFFFCNVAAVIHDVLAQGISVILVRLYRQRAVIEAVVEKELTPAETLAEGEKATEQGKKVYANYRLLRFLLRALGTFLGGIASSRVTIGSVFLCIILVQVIVLVFSLFCITEEKSRSIFDHSRSIFSDLGKFYKAIKGRDTLFPLLMIFLIRGCPEMTDAGTYILSDIMEWSNSDLSVLFLVSGILYYVLISTLIHKTKSLSVKTQVAFAAITSALHHFANFRFLYYQTFGFASMFTLSVISIILKNILGDVALFALVARFSLKCPKGLEGFGVTTLLAITNFAQVLGSLGGAQILAYYRVSQLDYTNVAAPLFFAFAFACVSMLLAPVFGR